MPGALASGEAPGRAPDDIARREPAVAVNLLDSRWTHASLVLDRFMNAINHYCATAANTILK